MTTRIVSARSRLSYWVLLMAMLLLGLRGAAFGATDLTIYDDTLAPGWQNWSAPHTRGAACDHTGSPVVILSA